MLIKYLSLCVFVSGVISSAIVVEVLSGDYEDSCGIYPPCRQYGSGAWQILENCHRYINCSLQQDGTFLQYNMACPGDLVFDSGVQITVTAKNGDWWTGSIGDKSGVFPFNYVEPLPEPLPEVRLSCHLLFCFVFL